jgi:hypothetical protein
LKFVLRSGALLRVVSRKRTNLSSAIVPI